MGEDPDFIKLNIIIYVNPAPVRLTLYGHVHCTVPVQRTLYRHVKCTDVDNTSTYYTSCLFCRQSHNLLTTLFYHLNLLFVVTLQLCRYLQNYVTRLLKKSAHRAVENDSYEVNNILSKAISNQSNQQMHNINQKNYIHSTNTQKQRIV